jgi:hypothetical protein
MLLFSALMLGVLVTLGLFYWWSRRASGRAEATAEPTVAMATYRHEAFLADYPEGWHCTSTETTVVFSEESDFEPVTAPVFKIELVPVESDSEPDLKAAIERVVLPSDTIKGEADRGKHGYGVLLERYDPQSQQDLKIYAVVEWNAFYSHLAYVTGSAPRERFSEVYPLFRDMHNRFSYLPPWPEQPFSMVTVERDLYTFECPVEWVEEVVQERDDSEIGGEWWCVIFGISRLDEDGVMDPTRPKTIQEFAMEYGMDRNSDILYHGPVIIDGREGYEYIAEFDHLAYRRRFRGWSTVVDDRDTFHAFHISTLIPASEWDKAEPIFRAMRDSFKFK